MWLLLSFLSAALLGCYDAFKKKAVSGNTVLPVLFLNTVFCSLVFLPFILLSCWNPSLLEGTGFYVPEAGWAVHRFVLLKSLIVLGSWVFGYVGMKHLPLTLVGPINATRPVLVLLGALLLFGERLNPWQWAGVTLAIVSFFLLSRSGRREGIDFARNQWIGCIVLAALLGALSGLYDKYLMKQFPPMLVQAWYNVYQVLLMCPLLLALWWPRRRQSPFRWTWCILGVSLFLSAADYAYFLALSQDGALVSVVSMVRRGSVIVSFLFGAIAFREKNLRSKTVDLLLVLLGMICLYIGSR